MSYHLMHRHRTPKGSATKTEYETGLPAELVAAKVAQLLPTSAWIHIQDESVSFPGKDKPPS